MFDLVIRDGTVFDGTGRDGVINDVGVTGGVVIDVGPGLGQGTLEIDAAGLYVAPGFIDGHTHLDAQIFWDPYAGSLVDHGVTSAVMGNCGFTLAPGTPDDADLILRSIERAEDMSRAAIQRGVPWRWETFPQFIDQVRALPKALNLAVQVGHSAVRAAVMGERAFEGPATPEDIEAMRRHVREAIAAGATGFSTSRSRAHLTKAGDPVASRLAPWAEVEQLVLAMTESGAGVFQLAPERSADPDEVADYQRRLGALVRRSGRPVTFMVGGQEEQLAILDAVIDSGGAAVGQVHVRGFENVYGFKTHLPFDLLPTWAEVRRAPLAEQAVRLRDPASRERLVAEAIHGPYGEGVGAELRAPDYEEVFVLRGPGEDAPLTDVAASRGTGPVEAMIDLSLETDFEQLFRQPISQTSEALVLRGLRHPHTVVAASDSGAHISQILDSNIPTFLLSHWVRDRQAFGWAEAIRMLTSVPAATWGFADRGVLRPGARGDVVVFDPATVGGGLPKVVNDLPDGSPRLAQPAVGIHATVVDGVVVMADGQPTGHTPGALIEGARWGGGPPVPGHHG